MSRFFADLSNNNGHFDARAYRKAGHLAVGLKATEGLGFVDPDHGERTWAAHAAGVKVIHYHFARPDNHPNGADEARAFWAAVRPVFRRGDRVALDLETPANGVNMTTYAVQFFNELRREAGASNTKLRHWPWLYSYTSFMHEHGVVLPRHTLLWLADYSFPILGRRAGLPALFAHQYTDGKAGPFPRSATGIGTVDMNMLSRRAWLLLRLRWRTA